MRSFTLPCIGVVCAALLVTAPAIAASSGQRLWVRTYRPASGGAVFRDVATGARGAAYAVGSKNVDRSTALIVVKYDGTGHQKWVRSFKHDYLATSGVFADVDTRGNVYVAGSVAWRNGEDGILLVKYAPDGTRKWLRTWNPMHGTAEWNSDLPRSIALDRAGNVYLAAQSYVGQDVSGLAVAKYGSCGERLWAVRYRDPADPSGLGTYPSDLALDGDGGVYVAGAGSIQPDYADRSTALTLKFSGVDGSLLASAVYGASFDAWAASVDVRGSTVAVCGTIRDQPSSGQTRALVVNYDLSLGQRYAVEDTPPTEGESASAADVVLDPAGDTLATGWSGAIATGSLTLSLDPDGALRWRQIHKSEFYGWGSWLRVDDSGNGYVGGLTMDARSRFRFLVIKYDGGGDPVWTRSWVDKAGHVQPFCFDLGMNGVYIGGQIRAHSRAVLVKYAR